MSKKATTPLEQLTLAALALPLLQNAHAGRVDEWYHSDFQYGHYEESNQRMAVDVYEGFISSAPGKAWTSSLNVVSDVISGASPVYNEKHQGKIQQILSGTAYVGGQLVSSASKPANAPCSASICDQRTAITPSLSYAFDNSTLSVGGGYSTENDYTARSGRIAYQFDFNQKLTTLNLASSVSFDELHPTPSPLSPDIARNDACGTHCNKTSQEYLIGLSQVIDKHSLWQNNVTFSYHNGFLSDPYKQVTFQGEAIAFQGDYFYAPISENRPRERFQWGWLSQYIRHFSQFNDAAMHVDYRLTEDDWNIESHTMEMSWHQPLTQEWQLVPRFRYYSQNAADFYQAMFNGKHQEYTFYSSDYRLAGFGAVSGGLKLIKQWNNIASLNTLKFQTAIDYYDHRSQYQLGGSSAGSFADFSYYLVTASLQVSF